MRSQGPVRDEVAVSAAVATVLLFGGVLSLIAILMVNVIPVIAELEGAVQRHDMGAQMSDLALDVAQLAETGHPGDRVHADLEPVDGTIAWDRARTGMWYSATWMEDVDLRVTSALDLDDTVDLRLVGTETTAVCFDDLRLGPEIRFHHRSLGGEGVLTMTPDPGLSEILGPVLVRVEQGGEELSIDLGIGSVTSVTLPIAGASGLEPASITSSHALSIHHMTGDGGALTLAPSDVSAADSTGRHWNVPLPSGSGDVTVLADGPNEVRWSIGTQHATLRSNTGSGPSAVTVPYAVDVPSLMRIESSASSHLLLTVNGTGIEARHGLTPLIAEEGAYLGRHHLTPTNLGHLLVTNPTDSEATLRWSTGGITLDAGSSLNLSLPSTSTGADRLSSTGPVLVSWSPSATNETDGLSPLIFHDTGGTTGGETHLPNRPGTLVLDLLGPRTQVNDSGVILEMNRSQIQVNRPASVDGTVQVSTTGGSVRAHLTLGTGGLAVLEHLGSDRCRPIGVRASGWQAIDLPWEDVRGRTGATIDGAWTSGDHPASLRVRVRSVDATGALVEAGTVWGFHLSRLSYGFESSIGGLEVAWTGGAVVTNHPELQPAVIVGPSARGGPGPRFAATVPAVHPDADSITGGGPMSVEVLLEERITLASERAHDVRRGWDAPYGGAIAGWSTTSLDASADWIVSPGRTDLLTDHVGWVPDPAFGTSETVWHAGGELVQFNLQVAVLDARTVAVNR